MALTERAHQLVDDTIPADDPMLRVLAAAPIDDEPLTPEEEVRLEEAYADLERGEVFSAEEMRRQVGLR